MLPFKPKYWLDYPVFFFYYKKIRLYDQNIHKKYILILKKTLTAACRCPEVRLNVISTLQHANTIMGADHLTDSLLPAIEELASDKHWRVRHAIIEKLPVLAEQMGVDFYQDKLLPHNRTWLSDRVASIRMAATVAIVNVARVFGQQWARDHALPEVRFAYILSGEGAVLPFSK